MAQALVRLRFRGPWWTIGIGAFLVVYAVALINPINAAADADDAKGDGPKIKVIYPNGGEVLLMGDKLQVQWRSSGDLGPKVRIELLRSNGLCTVIDESTANDGKFNWYIPRHLESDTDYSVRVIALGTGIRDRSRDDFSIMGAGLP